MRPPSFILMLILLLSCREQEEGVPNVIVIMTDDHATHALSAYGGHLNRTANLDRLAEQGLLFRNAFVTNSICAPSRAVILTSKYSHLNGVPDNSSVFDSAQLTFPKLFQEKGYETAIIGKWHLGSQPTGFDHWNVLPGQGDYYNPAFIKNGSDTIYQGYVTDIITDKTLEWLEGRSNAKPFMLLMHHKAPHRNWMPALRHLNEFEDADFSFPDNFRDTYQGRYHLTQQQLSVSKHMSYAYDLKIPCDTCSEQPINQWTPQAYKAKMNRLTDAQLAEWKKGYEEEISEFIQLDHADTVAVSKWKLKRYLQDYLRCVLAVDESVGQIIDYLEESGLAGNTVVVYTSDQGFFLGEHGLFDKRYMYEESLKTPLLMKYPREIKPGSVSEALVMNLDIGPTLLDLAGIEVPPSFQGHSLRPLFRSEKVEWRDAVYYQYYEQVFGVPAHYGLRTDRYKLIKFSTNPPSWEFYDLANDPKEMNNLYHEEAYGEIVQMLKQRIKSLQNQYQLN